ncbi:MAG TPA: HIT domain-containing protein, partial [Phototrophicaceae bacterium]|nr:HIT domain-containing protein [Phototrophicaceae bacterium]
MDHLWTPWRMAYIRSDKKAEGCVFCNLAADVNNDTQVLTRSKYVFVTLNLYPYNNGHLMVVPYEHIQTQEALSADALTDLMLTVNRCIAVLRQVYNPA